MNDIESTDQMQLFTAACLSCAHFVPKMEDFFYGWCTACKLQVHRDGLCGKYKNKIEVPNENLQNQTIDR